MLQIQFAVGFIRIEENFRPGRPRSSVIGAGGGDCQPTSATMLFAGLRVRLDLPPDELDSEEPLPESLDSRFTFTDSSLYRVSSFSLSVPRLRTEPVLALALLMPRVCWELRESPK